MAKTQAMEAIRGYMDYSTVHGLGRVKNSPHVILKVLWCLFILASLAMIMLQVINLWERYHSHPISTTIELDTPDEVPFPVVTICNTNPLNNEMINRDHPLRKVILEALTRYTIRGLHPEANNTDFLFDNDILWYTLEHFRMTMSYVDTESLVRFSESVDNFILLCNFASMPCTLESIIPVRTYEYGICYSILPEYQPGQNGSRHVTAAGQKFGLELLLNIEANNSVQFVSPSNGVYVLINDANVTENGSLYLHNGVVVPTGFQADISVHLKDERRVPGKTGKIRCSNTDVPLEDCLHNCQHNVTFKQCGCYRHFFKLSTVDPTVFVNSSDTAYIPCHTMEHFECIVDIENEHVKYKPTECKKCKVPCNERYYKRDLSISSWPNEGYMPILQNIVKTLQERNNPGSDVYQYSITRDYVRDNLLTVRVYLETLTHQTIVEEYSYSNFRFVSDIGGTLGLWAGFSVLSLLEIIELVLLLFASWRDRNKVQNNENKASSENEPNEQTQDSLGNKNEYILENIPKTKCGENGEERNFNI